VESCRYSAIGSLAVFGRRVLRAPIQAFYKPELCPMDVGVITDRCVAADGAAARKQPPHP